MAVAPFGDKFPLSANNTYASRIAEFISRAANYVLPAFKPGYALQASELNEIVEQFYLQQTLSNRCNGIWTKAEKIPFWKGCTPLSPSLVSTSDTQVSISPGWYFLMDTGSTTFVSGLGFWVYLTNTLTYSFSVSSLSTSSTSPTVFGVTYTMEEITASDDETLNDNANNANVLMSVPGADRIKLSISSISVGSSTYFSPLITAYNSSGTAVFNFPTP